MWIVRNLSYRQTILDFTSSGQGKRPVTALYGDDVCLVNALGLVDIGELNLQVQVCEACGIERCAPGGWITLRRLGTKVIWLPCFDLMAEDSDDFAPPRYRQGTPLLSRDLYEGLCQRVPGFPSFERVDKIRSRDVARLLQADAPGRALGRFPEKPKVDIAKVAATAGERNADVLALDRLLDAAFNDDMSVRPVHGIPVPFQLIVAEAQSWSPLARVEDRPLLCVGDEAVVLGHDGVLSGEP